MMKRMPYKVEEGAIERAKYRAKMAVREVAQRGVEQPQSGRVALRWALSGVAATVAIVAVVAMAMRHDAPSLMEQLIAEMNSASEEVIYEQMADLVYYAE